MATGLTSSCAWSLFHLQAEAELSRLQTEMGQLQLQLQALQQENTRSDYGNSSSAWERIGSSRAARNGQHLHSCSLNLLAKQRQHVQGCGRHHNSFAMPA